MHADGSQGAATRWVDAAWAALVTLTAGALAWTEFRDGDLGFHLATGREVLRSGHIPLTNVLSYTNPDAPWALHQWLPGVVFELVHRSSGVIGLQWLRVTSVAAVWLAVYGAGRAAGASAAAAACACLLGAVAAAFRFELRPYLYTHLALALTLSFALQFLEARRRGDAGKARARLVCAATVPIVACHLHAGVVDSWLVLAALCLGCAIEPWLARRRGQPVPTPGAAQAVALALLASIALAAISLTVYRADGARILLFPFDMGSDAYLAEHLVEFRSPLRFPFDALAPYWLLLVLALGTLAVFANAVHPFWPVVVLGFAALSLQHVRLVFGFAVIASPWLAIGLCAAPLARLRPSFAWAVALAIAALGLSYRYDRDPLRTGFAPRTWPEPLFEYLEAHDLKGHLYCSDAWAGPMLGRFYPARKAFFDNRFEAYPRAFFHDVYQHIRYGGPNAQRLLQRHDVQLVLMRYTTPAEAEFQKHAPNLRQQLSADPTWALVAFDDQGELFVRRAGPNAAHAAAFAIPGIDPDRATFLRRPRDVAPDLRRARGRAPASLRLSVFSAFAERDAGNAAAADALIAKVPPSAEARDLIIRLAKSGSRQR